MIIDTLHKESKSQRVITERVTTQSWLEGRDWIGKGAQATGMTAGLRILSSKADSNTWESFTRSELKLESVHQESPRSDIFRRRATKPLLKQKHRQKYLTWAKEKKNWTVAQWSKVLFSDESKCLHFIWKSRSQSLEEDFSSVKFPKSVMVWVAVTSAGVGPFCFINYKVNAAIYQEILKHFMLTSADKLYGDADFLFQHDFTTCPHCQNHFQVVCWPLYYCARLARQHAWPEPHVESMGYFLEKDEKQWIQQYRRAEGCATGRSLPCHISLMLEFVLNAPRPSTESINEHTLKNLNFSVLQILFLIDFRKYSNILRYWFLTFISCQL